MEDDSVMKWVLTTVLTAGVAFAVRTYIMLNTLLQRSNPDVMREQVQATKEVRDAVRQMVHYIRWLAKEQTGETPPPPTAKI